MKKLILLSLLTLLTFNLQSQIVKPTKSQLAFMDDEIGAFICYGLNVYTGDEHGDGNRSPKIFNPSSLDAEQWVRTAKSMGAKYAVLTARHEDGFCLWPTKTTDYSIANTPYKSGKGDIVKEFTDACHKYGVKVGIYFSTMYDAHHIFKREDNVKWGKEWDVMFDKRFGAFSKKERDDFRKRQIDQLTELLTNYGQVTYIWNDHWGNYMAPDIQKDVTDVMRKLQPNCIMLGPDVTTPGNESGTVVYPCWNAMDTEDNTNYTRAKKNQFDSTTTNDYGLIEGDVLSGTPFGKFWRSRECTTTWAFITGGWFWHPGKTKAKSFADHLNLYYRSVGLGANTIINLPPDERGLIPDDIAEAAKELGDEIKARFAKPIASLNKIKKSSSIELKWKTPCEINTIVTMENIVDGQRIAKYSLEAFVNGQWLKLQPENHFNLKKPYNSNPGFETIGHKKIDRIKPVVTNRIRFNCLKSIYGKPEIRNISVYNCAPINEKSNNL